MDYSGSLAAATLAVAVSGFVITVWSIKHERPRERTAEDRMKSDLLREMRYLGSLHYESEWHLMVSFLAALLPRKVAQEIKARIKADPDFLVRQHHFFGQWVRNQLRRAGFRYDAITLDNIWARLISDALELPKDKIKIPLKLKLTVWKIRLTLFAKSCTVRTKASMAQLLRPLSHQVTRVQKIISRHYSENPYKPRDYRLLDFQHGDFSEVL